MPSTRTMVRALVAPLLGIALIAFGLALLGSRANAAIGATRHSGAVAGRVVDASGRPLTGVSVQAYDDPTAQDATPVGDEVRVDSHGRYVIDGLVAGSYRIGFFPDNSELRPTYWPQAMTNVAGADVVVAAGATTRAVNVTIAKGAAITGTVTGRRGRAVKGVQVYTERSDGAYANTSAVTDAKGRYALTGLWSGTYFITFQPMSNAYLSQGYGGVTDPNGRAITLKGAQVRSGANVRLSVPASLSGEVVLPAGVNDSVARQVELFNSSGTLVATAKLKGSRYAFSELRPGSYEVAFAHADGTSAVAAQWFDGVGDLSDAEPTPVKLVAGQNRKGVDASLAHGAVVTGTTQSLAVGALGCSLQADAFTGGRSAARRDGTLDMSTGALGVTGLAAGTYQLTSVCANRADNRDLATVTVTAGESVDIDALAAEGVQVKEFGIDAGVKVTGARTVGSVVTASAAVTSPSATTVSWYWTRDDVEIPGATGPSYRLTSADMGHLIDVYEKIGRAGYLDGYPGKHVM